MYSLATIESNYKAITNNRKALNIWKPHNTFLNNPWIKEEVSREIKNTLK